MVCWLCLLRGLCVICKWIGVGLILNWLIIFV